MNILKITELGAHCALEREAVSHVGSRGRTPKSGAVEAVGAGGGVRS